MNALYINGDAYELKSPPTLTEEILLPYEEDHPPMCLVQPTYEFTLETKIDPVTLDRLLRDPYRDPDREFTVKYTYKEQARRHKKKRINKKWAKRYGYVVKQIVFENVTFEVEE